ncbi:hypothetical protein L2Y90_05900 [Burkholderia pyrrocinia]|uniref:hypothetical protein n=1 Tax=Burkholderia pyrrocinia TaxID=60550 RepID=UPI00215AAFCF|nr:hypothetical protein [Burkholderia pyrrocinia]UVE66655.1 hypothetical protein L2Y90_05900 [Burkholderia pyrrocinia]
MVDRQSFSAAAHRRGVAATPEHATIHVLRQQARGSARARRLVAFLATWFAQPAWDAARA